MYDPAKVGEAAIAELDKNKNGSIEGSELDASPALRQAVAAIDTNGDQKLTAAEIQKRISQYSRTDFPVTFRVTLDGQPLAGATMTIEREKFLGPSKSVTITTSNEGLAATDLPSGFYRIRVTKDDAKLPARYNTQTILGRELVIEPRQAAMTIDLPLTR